VSRGSDFSLLRCRRDEPQRRLLYLSPNLRKKPRLPVLNQDQNFGIIDRAHLQIVAVFLELVERPRACRLIEEDR
jgi:hypothetical protein